MYWYCALYTNKLKNYVRLYYFIPTPNKIITSGKRNRLKNVGLTENINGKINQDKPRLLHRFEVLLAGVLFQHSNAFSYTKYRGQNDLYTFKVLPELYQVLEHIISACNFENLFICSPYICRFPASVF